MKILNTLVLTLLALAFVHAHDVELRFVEKEVKGNMLYIDVDIRASSYDFSLASHNLRAYYDHESLDFIELVSLLPSDKYTTPQVKHKVSTQKNVPINVLSFDDDFGFINASVILNDIQEGGVGVTTDWQTIHTAVFKIKDHESSPSVVWALEGRTDEYATAFVEIAEWLSPSEIKAKNVFDVRNYEGQLAKNESIDTEAISIVIGPNPAQDKAIITHSLSAADLTIIDLSGQIVSQDKMNDDEHIVDMTAMVEGAYIFMIEKDDYSYTEQVVKR